MKKVFILILFLFLFSCNKDEQNVSSQNDSCTFLKVTDNKFVDLSKLFFMKEGEIKLEKDSIILFNKNKKVVFSSKEKPNTSSVKHIRLCATDGDREFYITRMEAFKKTIPPDTSFNMVVVIKRNPLRFCAIWHEKIDGNNHADIYAFHGCMFRFLD